MPHLQFWLRTSSTICLLLTPVQVMAQMTPDTTLPNNSQVNTSNNTTTISGGTRVGDNLYHSLSQFSVPTGGVASFDNAADIQNIFTRVTGQQASNIDGLIRANGGANLFLINPNGIIFGEGARLIIGGSFIGSTASSINFADGNNFPSQPQQTQPLLSVNVPIGLQFNNNSAGAIQVNGQGNQITPYTSSSPTQIDDSATGLTVNSGDTLALIGGDVNLSGSTIAAQGGRIELGSVSSGSVSLQQTETGLTFGFDNAIVNRNIAMSNLSALNASGEGQGAISLTGSNINIADGSLLLIQNTGNTPTGNISINAPESLTLSGTASNGNVSSAISAEALSAGKGSNITISTSELVLKNAAAIRASTFSDAVGGNVTINATKSIQLLENTSVNLSRRTAPTSVIITPALGSGDGGNITVSTPQLRILDGGYISSSTIGTGSGGNLIVNANEIELIGLNSDRSQRSILSASSFNAGDAGNVDISTTNLQVIDGAQVASGSFGTGNSGSVNINASSSVVVSGVGNNSPSTIRASADLPTSQLRQRYGLAEVPSGFSGNVRIDTPLLNVNSGATVSVRNQGTGNAGTLQITAQDINLDDSGSITAASASGNGGNITLDSGQLGLRSSEITATADNNGNGGNIEIDTGILTGTSDSRIVADAQQGTGGNININAQGFFFPIGNISASSQLGINGNIQIQTLLADPAQALVQLPQQPVDAKNQVVAGCPGTQPNASSSFTITGTGGLPEDPLKPLTEQIIMHDTRLLSQTPNSPTKQKTREVEVPAIEDINSSNKQVPQQLVEATGWAIGSKGEVILTASAAGDFWSTRGSCHGL